MLNRILNQEQREKLQQWLSNFTSWLDLNTHKAYALALSYKEKMEKSFGENEKFQTLSKDVFSRAKQLAAPQYAFVLKNLKEANQQLQNAANSPRVVDCRKRATVIFSEIASKFDPLARKQAVEVNFLLTHEALILMKNKKNPLVQERFDRLKEMQFKGYNHQQFVVYEEILNALNYEIIKNHIIDDGSLSQTLNLRHSYLTRFPGAILLAPEYQSFWTSLKSLNLQGNHLQSLPQEISQLVALEELKMKYNDIQSLPVEIGQLKKLTTLEVDQSALQALPAEIEQLDLIKQVKETPLAP